MKINRYFKPLTCAALSLAVSSIAFSAAFASQYSNSYRENTDFGTRDVQVQYTGLSKSMGFFDEVQPQGLPLEGQTETRLQVRQRKLQPIDYTKSRTGKTYRDGSIFGGTCCEATSDQDNSMIPGQGCDPATNKCDRVVEVKPEPCLKTNSCPARRRVETAVVETPDSIRYDFVRNYIKRPRRDVFASIHQKCGKYAPIQLEWVDFRLREDDINGTMAQKLGNYRFRIFGCRRFSKEAVLNQGRLMERNFRLIEVFDNELKDCFNIVKIPNDLCTEVTPSPLPEYLITAEITNYFMNICDKYNWDDSQREDKRIGSSEITVRWTITDINKTKVYWSGDTDGYGELNRGETNGEVLLIEKAFADAVNNLRNNPYFLRQVSRRFSPAEKESQRIQLIDTEKANNPVKCQYTQHDTEANQVSKYIYTPENRMPVETTVTTTTTTTIEQAPVPPAPQPAPEVRQPTPTVISRAPADPVVEDDTTIELSQPLPVPPAPEPSPAPLPPAPAPIPPLPAPSITTTTTTTTTTVSQPVAPEPLAEEIVIDNINVEEAPAPQPAPADILLTKESAPEPFDPSMSPKSGEEKFGKVEEAAVTTSEAPAPVGVGLPIPVPEKPCNNMTLFGPDCDCDNKHYRGCEDNKLYNGCEDNRLTDVCEDNKLFGGCDKGENICPIPADAEEKGGVNATGTISKESWINVPTDDKGAIEAQNTLCIVDRAPYSVPMSADDIYKIRTSIVSITNQNGKQGAGLLVDERFVLTSADMITKDHNLYNMRTINGGAFTGKAVRINMEKNTALLYLDKAIEYTPLSLNLELPPINSDTYLTLGILDFDTGEGYLEDSGKVNGYRYSEERGTEIIVDTYVQDITLGGALIDKRGTITGFAHAGKNGTEKTDLYLPIATALKSVGLEICGKRITDIPVRNTEISNAILFNSGSKEPLPMSQTERK